MGTTTYIPQNDPHGAPIILNIHNWGKKKLLQKTCPSAQAPTSQGPTWRSGQSRVKFFLCFPPIFEFSTKS